MFFSLVVVLFGFVVHAERAFWLSLPALPLTRGPRFPPPEVYPVLWSPRHPRLPARHRHSLQKQQGNRKMERQKDRETEKQRDRQKDRETKRQKDKKTKRLTIKYYMYLTTLILIILGISKTHHVFVNNSTERNLPWRWKEEKLKSFLKH